MEYQTRVDTPITSEIILRLAQLLDWAIHPLCVKYGCLNISEDFISDKKPF